MARQIFTQDQLPEFCDPLEVDEDGRTTKLEFKGFHFSKSVTYPMLWVITLADGSKIDDALVGHFTSIDQCIRAVNAVGNAKN